MSPFPEPYIYFSLACLTYIETGIVCGVIRWFHVCKCNEDNPDYHYPARRIVTLAFVGIILLLPYVFNPTSQATWLYTRNFSIVYYPVVFTLMLQKYFFCLSGHHTTTASIRLLPILLAIPFATTAAYALCGMQPKLGMAMSAACGTASAVAMWQLTLITRQMKRRISYWHEQNFSCTDDFPFRFAEAILWSPLLCCGLFWGVFLSDSQWAYCLLCMIMAVWHVAFLLRILHSQRAPIVEEIASECDDNANEACGGDTSLPEMVLSIVARRYVEPDLKRTDVIGEIPHGMKRAAGDWISTVGFYLLVNAFRLKSYEKYCDEHPELKKESCAVDCGFKDKWALYNARKRLVDFDFSIIRNFI